MKRIGLILIAGTLLGCGTVVQPSDEPELSPPHFFALSTADAEELADWYQRMFDLERVGSSESPDGRATTINLRSDNLVVEIVQHIDARSRAELEIERAFLVHGIYKVGFFVDDIDAEIERLTNRGAEFRGRLVEFPRFGVRTILVRDPEGNTIQLFEELD